jgi:hypothetical protein
MRLDRLGEVGVRIEARIEEGDRHAVAGVARAGAHAQRRGDHQLDIAEVVDKGQLH